MLRVRHARNVTARWSTAGALVVALAVAACGGPDGPTPAELADRRERQAGAAAAEAGLGDDIGAVRCERPAGQGWTCTDVPAGEEAGGDTGFGAFSPELVARTVEALEDARPSFTLDVVTRDLAGVEASCIRSRPVADSVAAPAWLCVAPDGVPLLVDRGDGSPELRAVAYRRGAAADDVARPDR